MKHIRRYDFVAFDLDGTLTDTLTSIAISSNAVLQDLGQPPLDIEAFPSLIGHGARRLVDGFLQQSYKTVPESVAAADVFDLFSKHFAEHCTVGVTPYKGIPELLQDLKAAGVRLAVLSNKPHAETEKIANLLFPGIFDDVYGQRDGVPRKPDPAVLLDLMDQYGVSSGRSCMVGDGDTDVLAGQKAGIDQIACGWGYRAPEQLLALNPLAYAPDVPTLRSLLFD
ncbi:MAG TPA: HAD-IA family hydrolase [Clostridiaceae bacterium]|jgi:phosphoglycolate phosphatase|nr:HAD-IA family hydrolase [Clostridiaceae bacterium]